VSTEQVPPIPNADRQVLELHALRQRQLGIAFLHGRRRSWRERRRIWPAVVVAIVLIALLVAGVSVAAAFQRQQELAPVGFIVSQEVASARPLPLLALGSR